MTDPTTAAIEAAIDTGPGIRATCRIINRNSCGSGTIVGWWNGGSLVFSNAHVCGTRTGREVRCRFLIDGNTVEKTGTVIEAMYSDRVIADWAIVFIPDWQEIEPVPMSRSAPDMSRSYYTNGSPRCVWPPVSTDITLVGMSETDSVIWWNPDAIGGQSGSSVIDDFAVVMFALLTWSWTYKGKRRGAGQATWRIYLQQTSGELGFHLRPEGLEELADIHADDMLCDWDKTGLDDPVCECGSFAEAGIQDYPIWTEGIQDDPNEPEEPDEDPDDPLAKYTTRAVLALHLDQTIDIAAGSLRLLGAMKDDDEDNDDDPPVDDDDEDPAPGGGGPTF